MRLFAFILLLLCALEVHAREPLTAVFAPKPEFPPDLAEARYAGKVRVRLTVGPSGTVQATRVVESGHPELALAVQRAVVQWRFKPWNAQSSGPNKEEFMVLVLFGARGIEPFSSEITVGLNQTLCAYLNHEIKASKRDFPEAQLSDVDVFWYMAEFLASDYVASRVPDENQRNALLVQFKKSIPQVATLCRGKPNSRYADHLPEAIRRLMLNLATDENARSEVGSVRLTEDVLIGNA